GESLARGVTDDQAEFYRAGEVGNRVRVLAHQVAGVPERVQRRKLLRWRPAACADVRGCHADRAEVPLLSQERPQLPGEAYRLVRVTACASVVFHVTDAGRSPFQRV